MTRPLPCRYISAPFIPDLGSRLGACHAPCVVFYYRTGDPGDDLGAAGEWCTIIAGGHNETIATLEGEDSRVIEDHLNSGGMLAGCIKYEAGAHFDNSFQFHCSNGRITTCEFLLVDCWYESDRRKQTARIGFSRNCKIETLDAFRLTLRSLSKANLPEREDWKDLEGDWLAIAASSGELSYPEYQERLEALHEGILSGEYYEVNFTQRFSVKSAVNPARVFRRLLEWQNPAKAFYYKNFDSAIAGASPEIFLIRSEESLLTAPIKGSWPKGSVIDERLREKLFAEHTMVIDLARNDLGRVCRAGSIETVQSYKTEAFGGMEHLVTRVRGEVISGIGWRAILKSTFPAASITGAPKSASTQAIARLEKSPRGVYCGACGIIGLETMDLNVAIRTISCEPAGDEHYQYRFGAGGAIVADSNISDEYEEMLRKSLPLVRAVADSNG